MQNNEPQKLKRNDLLVSNEQPTSVEIGDNENLPLGNTTSFLDLVDKITTTTTIPTYKPKIISQQIVVYVDSITAPTVKRLYIYVEQVGAWSYTVLT